MDGSIWRVTDSTYRERFGHHLGVAFVAFGHVFEVDGYLAPIARGAALQQGHPGRETETVDVAPGIDVVEAVEH